MKRKVIFFFFGHPILKACILSTDSQGVQGPQDKDLGLGSCASTQAHNANGWRVRLGG